MGCAPLWRPRRHLSRDPVSPIASISYRPGKIGPAPDPWKHVDLLEGTDTNDGPLDCAIAEIRKRFGVRSIRRGETGDPTGPYTGLKISFERVPSLEEVDLFLGPKWVVSGSVPA